MGLMNTSQEVGKAFQQWGQPKQRHGEEKL